MSRLLLIDGMAVTYRAYYALNHTPRVNSKGFNTSAVLGFVTTLLDLIQKLKPTHVGVAFDLAAPTFRHEEFPAYKANRPPTPEDIHLSIPYIKDIITGFRIPILCKEGYEADDVIGTLAHEAEKAGFDEVLMATPDKDFAQLVTSVVKLYRFGQKKNSDTIMSVQDVNEKFHVDRPEQVIDFLGLCGDSVDNIPGIPGVGDKSAQKLIAQFGSIEEMVSHPEGISNRHLRELVETHRDSALLSKHLATIVKDVPIQFDPDKLLLKDPDYEALRDIFAFLEFRQLSKRVLPANLQKHDSVVGGSAKSSQLDMFSQTEPDLFSQAESGHVSLAPPEYVKLALPHVIRVGSQVVCYDYKSVRPQLQAEGVKDEEVFDILLVHYLVDPEARHSLDFIAQQRLGIEMQEQQTDDTMAMLYPVLKEALESASLQKIYYGIELPLVEVLISMEQEGVLIDVEAIQRYSAKLTAERAQIESQIYALSGHTFNISSPRQLGEVLYEELRVTEKPPRTATKQYSTAEDVLVKLRESHPIIPLILEYRSITKLIGTYLDSFPKLISTSDGRLHTVYNQAVTATGRLSSSSPNLQNIPIRTERGRYIRQAFVARDEEHLILAADYSQIELRLIAAMAEDENMIHAFESGQDIHAATAAKIYHIPIEEVTKDQRRNAKSVNFGIVYGISAFGLSEQLGCSRKEAQQLISEYFEQFPSIRSFIDREVEEARTNGYAHTVLGRRRYLPEITSRNPSLRSFAERNAVNMPIQGTSADMIKIAMVQIYHEFTFRNLRSKMILQVHDELVFDVYRPELPQVRQIVEEAMQQAARSLCNIPIEVGIDVGTNWLEAH